MGVDVIISDEENVSVTKREGKLLYTLAKKCRGYGVIVEIGSWKGRSTIYLAKGSKAGNSVRVYSIDPHTGSSEHKEKFGEVWTFDEFMKNIKSARVDDIITPIVKTSEEAAKEFDKPVELIFIDGAHEYEFVKKDFEMWFPKVVEGGIMAFHDTGWPSPDFPGPKRVVRDFVYFSKHFKDVKFVDSITYGIKVSNNSIFDRIKNVSMYILNRLYEKLAMLRLPGPIRSVGKKIFRMITG